MATILAAVRQPLPSEQQNHFSPFAIWLSISSVMVAAVVELSLSVYLNQPWDDHAKVKDIIPTASEEAIETVNRMIAKEKCSSISIIGTPRVKTIIKVD